MGMNTSTTRTPRTAELYSLVLTTRILKLRGIGAREVNRLIASGALQRIQRGAYIYASDATGLRDDDRLRVRCIAAHKAGLQGVFSHESAAVLWGLDLMAVPTTLNVYSNAKSSSDRGRIRRHRSALDSGEVTTIPGTPIPVTTVTRTLQDCVRTMPFRNAVVLTDSVMRRGLLTPEAVTDTLTHLTGCGRSNGSLVIRAMDASSESAGESLTRCLLMEHELPSPVTQYPIVCEGQRYRTDFAWPELRVILEFDGEQKYVDYPGRDRQEAARDRALTRAGWTVIHLTWADIFQKEREVVTHLRRLLLR